MPRLEHKCLPSATDLDQTGDDVKAICWLINHPPRGAGMTIKQNNQFKVLYLKNGVSEKLIVKGIRNYKSAPAGLLVINVKSTSVRARH